MQGILPLPDEQAELAEQALEMRRLTSAQRMELFCSIMQTIGIVWARLSPAEQWRRIRIGEAIDGPALRPWWMGVRPDARPDSQP